MGIDVYMNWGNGPSYDGKYEEAFRGANGYLRESYHGGPYATVVLVPEAFGDPLRVAQAFGMPSVESLVLGTDVDGYSLIPAGVLRARLGAALLTVAERYRTFYHEECGEGHPALREFVEFVELAEVWRRRSADPSASAPRGEVTVKFSRSWLHPRLSSQIARETSLRGRTSPAGRFPAPHAPDTPTGSRSRPFLPCSGASSARERGCSQPESEPRTSI